MEEAELPSIVSDSWSLSEGSDFLTKVKHCTDAVDAWGKRLRSRYREEIKVCHKIIEEERAGMCGGEDGLLVATRSRLSILLAQEDAF